MRTTRILPVSLQNAVPPILFDPDGDVLTTHHLDAFVEENRPMLNNYVRYVRIGKGQHGDVYLCQKINSRLPIDHPDRRIPVAMKSVKRNNPRENRTASLLRRNRLPSSSTPSHIPVADRLSTTEAKIKREIAIMKKLRHPHVVRLYEVIDDRIQEKIYMVMEYLGGGEVKWRDADNNPVLTVSQTRRILRDAVLGLEYLHIQGIIHRDIKPANLLWTEDRRQIKIADFGVSHFSYAQRLAAAGGQTEDDPNDPILIDETGLAKRAGTPSFLAPEVVWEHSKKFQKILRSVSSNSTSPSPSSPSSTSIPSSPGSLLSFDKRPLITKSIDVWALGVTLYCLLFGTTPFVPGPDGNSEYSLYCSIVDDDWPAPPHMGFDRLPSGGRHPEPGPDGPNIIHLLEHFLQKDANLRITLDEVKTNPWFLKDLADPKRWAEMTSPNRSKKIDVSANEATDAMSAVHFRWRWGRIAHHVSSLFRRPPRRVKANTPTRMHNIPDQVVSDPASQRDHFPGSDPPNATTTVVKVDKGKQKAESSRARTLKRPASKGTKSLRSKSTERWSEMSRGNSTSTSALQQAGVEGSSAKPRRGSDPRALDRAGVSNMTFTPITSTTTATPRTVNKGKEVATRPQPPSATTSTRGKRRARFTLFNISNVINWRPNYAQFRTHPSGTGGASGTTSTAALVASTSAVAPSPPLESEVEPVIPEETQSIAEIVQTPANMRRSEEALNRQPFNIDHDDPGALTAARRASSWGQGDTDLAEIVNVPSIGYNLNEHDMIVGAGGVAVDGITVPAVLPGPSTPRNAPRVMSQIPRQFQHGAEDDEYRRYGEPVYDDDSSTIDQDVHDYEDDHDHDHDHDIDDDDDLDERGSWQRGSQLDVFDDRPHDDDHGDEFDQESSDDEDDEDDEPRGPVTFSPRRHGRANHEEGA